jgi:hypothetical protein
LTGGFSAARCFSRFHDALVDNRDMGGFAMVARIRPLNLADRDSHLTVDDEGGTNGRATTQETLFSNNG